MVTEETAALVQEKFGEANEYWVLETAVEGCVPLRLIWGTSEFLKCQWNKPAHRCSRKALVDLLFQLANARDIAFFDGSLEECSISRGELEEQLQTVRRMPNEKYYGLTTQGGVRWETWVTPDWNRYYSFERTGDVCEHCEITSSSPSMTDRAFRYVVRSLRLRVIESSVMRNSLSPWHATYWKTLKFGASIRFDVENQDLKETEGTENLLAEELFFRQWYTRPGAEGGED